jgi:hypothetical protein
LFFFRRVGRQIDRRRKAKQGREPHGREAIFFFMNAATTRKKGVTCKQSCLAGYDDRWSLGGGQRFPSRVVAGLKKNLTPKRVRRRRTFASERRQIAVKKIARGWTGDRGKISNVGPIFVLPSKLRELLELDIFFFCRNI